MEAIHLERMRRIAGRPLTNAVLFSTFDPQADEGTGSPTRGTAGSPASTTSSTPSCAACRPSRSAAASCSTAAPTSPGNAARAAPRTPGSAREPGSECSPPHPGTVTAGRHTLGAWLDRRRARAANASRSAACPTGRSSRSTRSPAPRSGPSRAGPTGRSGRATARGTASTPRSAAATAPSVRTVTSRPRPRRVASSAPARNGDGSPMSRPRR